MVSRPDILGAGSARSDSREARALDAWSRQFINLLLIALMTVPALIGAAGPLRLLFPVFAVAIAGAFVLTGRFAQYVTFCIWLFLLTPGIRRIVDFQVGWEAVNTLMLAPYAAALFSLGTVPALIERDRGIPGRAGFLAVVAAATYGLLLAVVHAREVSGAYDYLRWIVPPCFGMLVALNHEFYEELQDDIVAALALGVSLLSAYGIYQYRFLPDWDAFWMKNAEMNSIGLPEPLLVRVFSTMNSPGSFASFLMVGLLVLLTANGLARWLAIALGCAAFALTIVRSSWLGFALGVLVIIATAPLKTRSAVIGFGAAALVVAPFLLINPDISALLESRIQTFGRISGDESLNERLASYRLFLEQIGDTVFGAGLAINGSYQSYVDGGQRVAIDGGPIEIFMALGPIGGFFYMLGVGMIAGTALLMRVPPTCRAAFSGYGAVIVANLALLSSGTTTVGEVGFFFWLAVGLSIAVGQKRR